MATSATKYSRVMIIDDSEMDIFLNKMILETTQFSTSVSSFTNPVTALNYFKELLGQSHPEEKLPQIIFLDINMPFMNGFQFLDEFLKLPPFIASSIKFYMISSSEDPEDVEKIKNYPSVIKYLNKPLDKNQLQEVK